jgi:hypothetical protein
LVFQKLFISLITANIILKSKFTSPVLRPVHHSSKSEGVSLLDQRSLLDRRRFTEGGGEVGGEVGGVEGRGKTLNNPVRPCAPEL